MILIIAIKPSRTYHYRVEEKMKKPLILVTDDEEMVTEILDDGLRIFGVQSGLSVEVELSKDPLEAIQLLKTIKYDLLLLDHRMPSIKGVQLAKELRLGSGPNKNTPIIFISAYLEEVQKQTNEMSNVNYIDKPLIFQNLISSIKRSLNIEDDSTR